MEWPPLIDSLEDALRLALGGFLLWLGTVLKKWVTNSTRTRREIVDELAQAEEMKQQYKEAMYELRSMMLKSGNWRAEDLPKIPRDDKHRLNV